MFSSIKMEEYIESELSGIFRVKLVTKNRERGSLGTQFMHMRAPAPRIDVIKHGTMSLDGSTCLIRDYLRSKCQ